MAPTQSLFQVYLRLRPQDQAPSSSPWLLVEDNDDSHATHVTLQPPNDSRKRAIERFGFTKIFKEEASQLQVFQEIGAADNLKQVLQEGRDGLIATLGVTGSGKVGLARDQEHHHISSDIVTEPYHPRIGITAWINPNDA